MRTVVLDRYLEWDEAVFYSQSGGLNGSGAEPAVLVASREIGPPRLIGLLRSLSGGGLADTRLLWMIVGLALLIVSCWAIGRVCRTPGWLVLGLVGSFWLMQLFIGGFFGFAIAAALTLAVLGSYLYLRTTDAGQLRIGFLLGLAVAAMLWMRQVEGALLLAVIGLHSLVVTPRRFWRARWQGGMTALAVAVIVFLVPWIVDSSSRYGSIAERLASGQGQDFPYGLTNNFEQYVSVLRGRSFHYARVGLPPSWSLWVVDLLLAIFALLVIRAAMSSWRHRRALPAEPSEEPRVAAIGLCFASSTTLLGFFFFFIGPVSDRYLLMGLAPGMVVVAAASYRFATQQLRTSQGALTFLALILVAWGSANTFVAVNYETGRAIDSASLRRTGETIRSLAGEESCEGVSRYGRPQIQLISGCSVHSGTLLSDSLSEVARLARAEPGRMVFLLWPTSQVDPSDVPDGWIRLERPVPTGADQALIFRPPR